MSTKKATKELPELKFKAGDYVSADYKVGKKTVKVRGIIFDTSKYHFSAETVLANKGFGKETDCDYMDDVDNFNNFIPIHLDNYCTKSWSEDSKEYTWEQALKNAGLSNVKKLTDKRQKAVVDRDKNPVIAGYPSKITVSGTGKEKQIFVEFGCGAIRLSLNEIKMYATVRKLAESLKKKGQKSYFDIVEDMKDESVDERDFTLEEVQQLIKIAEKNL